MQKKAQSAKIVCALWALFAMKDKPENIFSSKQKIEE